jgi:signal transduction histidine kinase
MPRRDETIPELPARRCAIAKMFAHDFRNPISALTANVSYLQSQLPEIGPDIRGAVDDCASSLAVLRHLVDNFVLIARLEAGEHVEPSPLPLRQFVGAVLQESRGLVSTSEAELRLEGDVPDEICTFELPCAALVVKNLLLAAAAQAVGTGGVVTLRVTSDGERVRFSVCDTGPVVEEAYRDDLLSLDLQLQAKSLSGVRYSRGFGLYAAGLGASFLGGGASVAVRDGLFEIAAVLPLGGSR